MAEQLKAKLEAQKVKPFIVKVRYYSETTGEFSAREYTYYSADPLSICNIVTVPVRDTIGKAMVSAIDVPEAEIANFKDKVKMIPTGSVEKENKTEELAKFVESNDNTPYLPDDSGGESATPIPKELTIVEADTQVIGFYQEALKAKEYAEARTIITVDDLLPATDDLSLIAKLKKAMESKRKEYVKPLQDRVKAVNDTFKTLMEPIETADKITRDKILAFQLKQKLIREEQERINALRLEAATKEAALNNGEISESVNLIEVIAPPPDHIRTEVGTSSIVKRWDFEVVDFSILPDQYKLPDMVKIRKVITAGATIPGVKAWQEANLRVKPT